MKYLVMLALAVTLGACSSSQNKSSDSKDAQKTTTSKKSTKKSTKKAAAKMASGDAVVCETKSYKRTIQVENSPEGCVVKYSKDGGEAQQVAEGGAGSDHCANVASKIKSNLEGNGFTCK